MAARKKKLTHALLEAGHSRRCFSKTDDPFYFTSSPSLPLYSAFLLYFPLWFYKRNWHPDPDKMVFWGTLVHHHLGLLPFWIKSYSLPQHLVSWFIGLLCSEQSVLALGNTIVTSLSSNQLNRALLQNNSAVPSRG